MNGRFLINRGDAKVMGVAAGLADYTGIDPTIVRVGFVALTLMTGPVMVFLLRRHGAARAARLSVRRAVPARTFASAAVNDRP